MAGIDGRPTGPSRSEDRAAYDRCLLAADHQLTRGLVEAFNHHARTPLSVILGHAEVLLEDEHELPSETQRSLAAMVRAGQRLNDVVAGICDLIDVASSDPNRLAAVDLAALVEEEVARCRGRAAGREVRVLVTGRPSPSCVADARRVRRALGELLENALTYAPEGSLVEVATSTTVRGVRVAVTDQGEGIALADRERLTRPFERGSHPRQPTSGRGMGLALASAVAASHRGRLILSENVGGGLQACLELPTTVGPRTEARTSRHSGRK